MKKMCFLFWGRRGSYGNSGLEFKCSSLPPIRENLPEKKKNIREREKQSRNGEKDRLLMTLGNPLEPDILCNFPLYSLISFIMG